MTIRLYDKDVDMLDFSAVVKTCAQRENGYVVTLDQTAFFPEGGGQGADHGTLGGVQVLDAHDVHGEVEHLVSAPLAIGSEVRGHVDAASTCFPDWCTAFSVMITWAFTSARRP